MIKRVLLCFALALTVGVAHAAKEHKISPSTQRMFDFLGLTEDPVLAEHDRLAKSDKRAAAEAERMEGMFALLDCDVEKAKRYFVHALLLDPKNVAIQQAIVQLRTPFLREYWIRRSEEFEVMAYDSEISAEDFKPSFKVVGGLALYLLQLNEAKFFYKDAIRCDLHNTHAIEGFARVWGKLHNDWTFLNRLGFLPTWLDYLFPKH